MKFSILQPDVTFDKHIPCDAVCYMCEKPAECRHHIYGGNPNRRISEENGFWVYLCNDCHNIKPYSVHFCRRKNEKLKRECQTEFEKTHDRSDFIKLIGRSYL